MSLATVIDVCPMLVIGDASVVLTESRFRTARWTAPRVEAMFAGVIWEVVAHPSVI